MADPQAAALSQLRNIENKTGQTLAQLHAALAATGLARTGERRAWLMERFGLGYGDANSVALLFGKTLPALETARPADLAAAVHEGDALAGIYAGPKAHLRPLHEAVIALVDSLGAFEQAPKKAYVSLRRQKQFATLGPATQALVELGLNHKALPEHPRLKRLAPGGMCNASVRLGQVDEIDADLAHWLRLAYDAAA